MKDPSFQTSPTTAPRPAPALDAGWLRRVALDAGADDVGFVSIDRPELAGERPHALRALPGTRTFLSLVVRMNREPIRSPARSVANLEFHHTGDALNEVCRRIVRRLEEEGVRALNPAMGFPMETSRWPGRLWVVAHKTVAEAAGLGRIGIHRNVIHPRFGNFVLLGTVLIAAEVDEEGRRLEENPCLECKLCVAACPTGAIKPDGAFDFAACYTHNYREFMSGFTDWVETVADSRDARAYRRAVSDDESVSMWQSLGFGPSYKAAYCLSVCPAGEDVIGPYLEDKREHKRRVVRPLQEVEETVYVVAGSDAEEHVAKRFPSKRTKRVGSGLRPVSVDSFLAALPLLFQRGRAAALDATYHFVFTGGEGTRRGAREAVRAGAREVTVRIERGTLRVADGLIGQADLRVRADAEAWVGFLRRDRGLLPALLLGRIRLRGDPRLLLAFARCFPS